MEQPPERRGLGGARTGQGGGRGLGDAGWRRDLERPEVEGGAYFGGLQWEKAGSVQMLQRGHWEQRQSFVWASWADMGPFGATSQRVLQL